MSWEDKVASLQQEMEKQNCSACVLTALDDIACKDCFGNIITAKVKSTQCKTNGNAGTIVNMVFLIHATRTLLHAVRSCPTNVKGKTMLLFLLDDKCFNQNGIIHS